LLDQLIHNGVIVPEKEPFRGLHAVVRGVRIALTPHQEEMALAFARKAGTPYVEDPVFVANFMRDWSDDLGVSPALTLDEVDLSEVDKVVAAERAAKEALTPAERKALADKRRVDRERLKAKFGYAVVNGQRVELGTYMVEPSGIFMGRGQHPLRGRWKEGAAVSDITLNCSPDHKAPNGDWEAVVWQPESLWVARWKDKLTGKLKYIWLSDTAPIKQEREAAKFDKATELDAKLDAVLAHIDKGLDSPDRKKMQIATAVYLIDTLCLRVGDEKDEDEEADTVGATTLRREHLVFHDDGTVEFHFLGKDSVEWHKMLKPDARALHNLRQLAGLDPQGRSDGDGTAQLFPDVTSAQVNDFLSEVIPGLSAKVFRTHHATRAVRESLAASGVGPNDSDYLKWVAASEANLAAAELCNHTKQNKSSWESTQARYEQRIAAAQVRLSKAIAHADEQRAQLVALQAEAEQAEAAADSLASASRVVARYVKRIGTVQRRVESAQLSVARAQEAVEKLRAQLDIAGRKRTWNTSTSLKSYVDPRVYYRWGQAVNYDVLSSYYPATLQRKFAWVRAEQEPGANDDMEVTIRPCLPAHLVAVATFFQRVSDEYRDLALPTEPAGVALRFLPRPGEDWRAALVILGEEQEVLGLVGVGPFYRQGTQRCLDIYAVLDPDVRPKGLDYRVAAEVESCVEAFDAQHPKQRREPQTVLRPLDATWLAYAPELEKALALKATEEADA